MEFTIAAKCIRFPCSWQGVSLGQLLEIRSGRALSTLDVIAILSGESAAFWQGVHPAEVAKRILPFLEWSNEAFDWNALALPLWYGIGEKPDYPAGSFKWAFVYFVPDNLDLETYAQKVYIESLIGNPRMSDAERVPLVLAAYFEPLYSGKSFDTERLSDFLPLILKTSCTEALPIYSFFYRRYFASMVTGAG